MLIQLPNETWMEILNWLRRRDLIEKLDQLWDRQFTPIVQGWLHVYTRNVKIGRLAAKANGLRLCLDYDDEKKVPIDEKEVPIAQVEMPENITSFEQIRISSASLNPDILAFLQRMRPLFRNICLNIRDIPDEDLDEDEFPISLDEDELPIQLQTTIRLLMPLISDDHGQIESFHLEFQWLQFLVDNYPTSIFNAKLLRIWNYKPDKDKSELLTNWLFTRREDGQPRTLVFSYNVDEEINERFGEFCTKIRERFLDSARQPIPCPFFIRIWMFNRQLAIPAVTENVATGEQLTIQGVEHSIGNYWLITNCPMDTDGEWLTKKTAEVLKWDEYKQQRTICLVPFVEPLFFRMMNALKRMINNWWMTMFG